MSRRRIHEIYHQNTKNQKKIITEKNFTYRLLLGILNDKIKGKKLKVLDIGCGAGTICFYLANKGHLVTGVDISQKAINECRRSAKQLGLQNLEFTRLDFPNETLSSQNYNVVILTEVLEHLINDNRAIDEIFKLLKPGGIIILSTPSKNAPLYKLGMARNFDIKVGHLRRYKLADLKNMLTENNFKIMEIKKTEGIIRNFLFVNSYAGKLVRVINRIGSDFITFLDDLSLLLFGESNYIIIAKKPKDL